MGNPEVTMDPNDARKQINNMKEFILHEAREQVQEIEDQGQQQAAMERDRLVQRRKLELEDEHTKKKSMVEVEEKIKESNSQNKEKLKVLAHKTQLIEEAFMQAAEQCKDKAQDATIIQGLIRQGMQSFSEGATIKVSCRKQDDSVVQSAMSAVSKMLQKDPKSIEKSHACTLMPTLSECLGGVILSNSDNTVIVDQTFNARLNVCMERAIPIVKPILFGEGGS